MTLSLKLVFEIVGLVLLLLAGLNVNCPHVNLGWLGAFFIVLFFVVA